MTYFSRETEPIGCVYLEKETYFKELAHMITDSGESEIYKVGWWAEDPEKKSMSQFRFKVLRRQNSLLLGGVSLLF